MAERVKIGELLVETGLISEAQLQEVLELQKTDSRRLGELVVATGVVSESKVTQILSQQLSIPWVSLEYIDFSRQLLNLVSAETAQEHKLVPIYVRRGRNRRETLYVAMEDPSDQTPLDEVSEYSGLPVRPMIAPPTDIRAAIRAYYLGLPPEDEEETSVDVSISDHPSSEPVPISARSIPPSTPEPEEANVPVRKSDMPEPIKEAPAMITLTMLDGTEMKLPAGAKVSAEGGEGALTARDLVEALRAQAEGADVSEVFGENVNWQRMFAALLSLLLKKHLIHDWEFVRELKK